MCQHMVESSGGGQKDNNNGCDPCMLVDYVPLCRISGCRSIIFVYVPVLTFLMVLLILIMLQNQWSLADTIGVVVLSAIVIFNGANFFYWLRYASRGMLGIWVSTQGLLAYPDCWIAWGNIARVDMRRGWVRWSINIEPISTRKLRADEVAATPLFYRFIGRVFLIRSISINSDYYDGDPDLLLGFIQAIVAEPPHERSGVVKRAYNRYLAIRMDIREFADSKANPVASKSPTDQTSP